MAAKKSYIITTRKEAWHHPGSRSNGTIQGVVYKRLKECTRARKCHVLARQKRHERRIPWIQSVRRVRALQRDATWPHQSVEANRMYRFQAQQRCNQWADPVSFSHDMGDDEDVANCFGLEIAPAVGRKLPRVWDSSARSRAARDHLAV